MWFLEPKWEPDYFLRNHVQNRAPQFYLCAEWEPGLENKCLKIKVLRKKNRTTRGAHRQLIVSSNFGYREHPTKTKSDFQNQNYNQVIPGSIYFLELELFECCMERVNVFILCYKHHLAHSIEGCCTQHYGQKGAYSITLTCLVNDSDRPWNDYGNNMAMTSKQHENVI